MARYFVQLKCSLMPYLYAKAVEAHEDGTPVMRPMVFEFEDDPACQSEYADDCPVSDLTRFHPK